MEHSQKVFRGEVDRISHSGNAIVNDTKAGDSINLGSLSPEVVGEKVLFFYEGGTFGSCIDARYIDRDYIKEMPGAFERILINVDVPEMINSGDILFLQDLFQIPESSLTDVQYLASARIPPIPDEKTSEVSQLSTEVFIVLIQDSTIQTALPAPVSVEVTKVNTGHIETTGALDNIQYELPDIGETITVTTFLQTELGTLAAYEADCHLRVVIQDAQYPSGETIQIKVTDIKSTHIVGEAVFSADDFDVIAINKNKIPSDRRQSRSRVISQMVPIDIEPLVGDAPTTNEVVVTGEDTDALTGRWNIKDEVKSVDIAEGDELEIEIQSICGDTCIGHHKGFPIQVKFDRAISAELSHQSLSVLIQAIHSDRAIAEPTWITETHDEITVHVIDNHLNDALAINEKRLVIIPDSSVVSPGDQLRVSFSELSSDGIATATVSARPIFQDVDITRSIRLPNTRGDVVYTDKTPVVVDHLPDIDSTVTLGVSEVNEDHIVATVSSRPTFQDIETTQLVRLPNTRGDVINVDATPIVVDHLPEIGSTVTLGVSEVNEEHVVPTVDALPETHKPETGDNMLVEIEEHAYQTSNGITVGTSEELPLNLLPPFAEITSDTVTARVCKHPQSIIWCMSDDTASMYRYLQSADSALRQHKYSDAIQHLTGAIQSCSSNSLLERLLVIHKTMAQAMVSIQSNSSLTDTADIISTGLKRLREFDEDNETATNITEFLSAREAEMKAIELLVTILSDLTDVDTDMQEIKTLRCRPMIFEAIEHLRTAERRGAKTQFEKQTPSFAVWLVTQEFQDKFPLDVYQARHSQSLKDSSEIRSVTEEINDVFSIYSEKVQQSESSTKYADWLHCLLEHGVSEYDDVTLTRADADSNIWHRPATPEKMGITPITEIENNNNAHIESAQNSDSETSTTEQTLTSRDDSEGGTETTSAGGTSSGKPTAETNETETQTEPESSTGRTNPTGESPPTNLPKLQRLRKQAERESSENPKREDVSSSTTTTSRYKRSSAVREYALARAEGTCEVCNKDAPFLKKNGDPYLEVHHVNELSEGGADDPSIVGAVCPSCHKEIHYGEDGDELNEKLRKRLQDGLGNVGVVDK